MNSDNDCLIEKEEYFYIPLFIIMYVYSFMMKLNIWYRYDFLLQNLLTLRMLSFASTTVVFSNWLSNFCI